MRRGIYHENLNPFTPVDHPNQYFEKQLCCIIKEKSGQTIGFCLKDLKAHV